MVFVGPRPALYNQYDLIEMRKQAGVDRLKPGITGYAAVYGRNSLPWHDRLKMDVEYVRTLSFPLDVKIFFKTFSTVFKQEGVFVEDEGK